MMKKLKTFFKNLGFSSVTIELFKTSLFYANPIATESIFNKIKNKSLDSQSAYLKILRGYVISSIIMLIFFTIMGLLMNFKAVPILLDSYVLSFLLITMAQSMIFFYNIFYEGNDVYSLMPLPIKESSIFLSKFLVIYITTILTLVPILPLLFCFLINYDFGIILSMIYAIIGFLGISIIIMGIGIHSLQLTTKLPFFISHSRKINNILTVFSSSSMLILMVIMPRLLNPSTITTRVFGPLSAIFSDHLWTPLFILILAILSICLCILISHQAIGNFYPFLIKMTNAKNIESRNKVNNFKKTNSMSQKKILTLYNNSIFKDNTSIFQIIISTQIIPPAMILPQIFSGTFTISNTQVLPQINLGLCIALFFATTNFATPSLASIMFSADKNFYYLKSMPLDINPLFWIKVKYAILRIVPITILVYGSIAWFAKLDFIPIIFGSVIIFLVAISATIRWILFDLKHLELEWQNITQLLSRVGKGKQFLIIFGGIFLNLISIGIAIAFPRIAFIQIIIIILLTILFLIHTIFVYKKKIIKNM